jgi:hypothetical protein
MAGDRLTTPTPDDVRAYLDTVPDERRRTDAIAALELIHDVTGAEPVMWGSSMIGFGTQRYTTADGKEREWFAVGLAPRKAALTLYGLTYDESHQPLLDRLGPHTTGKGCLYVKRLDALDRDVLAELVGVSWGENSSA